MCLVCITTEHTSAQNGFYSVALKHVDIEKKDDKNGIGLKEVKEGKEKK